MAALRWAALTIGGIGAGIVAGYLAGMVVWLVVGILTAMAVVPTTSGGWAEAGTISGIAWLAAGGAIAAAVQSIELRRHVTWTRAWVLASACAWALTHVWSMLARGRAGDVDAASVLPLAAGFSAVAGTLVYWLASSSSPSASSSSSSSPL